MKILIRLPNWLGDVVMSTAFITAVKQHYPEAQVDVIIKKDLHSLTSLIPGLTRVHSFSKQEHPGLGGVYRFGKTLRSEKYDLFFTLPDSFSSAIMGWATRARQRIGFSKEGSLFLLTKVCKRPLNMHRVDEYMAILEQFSKRKFTDRQVKLQPGAPVQPNNLVLVNFNSEAESRRMPPGKGINMINILTNAFKETTFAFIGSPKDAEYVDQFMINVDNKHQLKNYTGKTDLVGLANLMAGAKVVLTTDSGPAHLANSVGTPVIALFGAGNENNTAPYNKANLIVLRAGMLECEPCLKNVCLLYGMPKCMKLIDETNIINALKTYL
jgi:lipopolysaccharide heptosyltransferase II